MDIETLLAVGGLVIGGAGAFATAVSAYLVGRHRATISNKKIGVEAVKVEVEEKKVEVEEKKIEALERRIDLEHHEAIVNGYKDLIVQYQLARDLAHNEVRELRVVVSELSGRVEILTMTHEKCETENRELKGKYDAQQTELQALRNELAEMKAAYGHNTSATPEVQATDAQNAA